jgi:hypothetical protein
MASLTYQRLIKGLNSLAEKAMTDLPGPTFSHHRDEISRLIKDGLAAAQAGLAQLPGSESPGQIKHWVGEKVDEILEGVIPPTITSPAILKTPARNKRITRSTTRSTTATAAGFKKRYNSRAKSSAAAHSALPATSSTRADIECANTLLSAGIASRSSRRSARVPTFTREDIECASILLELAFKPIVFDRLARISTAPVAKDFWSVIA